MLKDSKSEKISKIIFSIVLFPLSFYWKYIRDMGALGKFWQTTGKE